MKHARRGRMPTRARYEPVYDLVCVGVGPSDLSLAAPADPVPDARAMFFEVMPKFRWHPGLLDGDALIQISCLKEEQRLTGDAPIEHGIHWAAEVIVSAPNAACIAHGIADPNSARRLAERRDREQFVRSGGI